MDYFIDREYNGETSLEGINETLDHKISCLDALRSWLIEETPRMTARVEDKHLLLFLRGCKFNLSKTKQKLINYYMMKRDRPEWFSNRNPFLPDIKELIKMGVFIPLRRLHENKLVIIVRTAAHDPKRHTLDDVCKVGHMILDIACLENEYAQIFGLIAIFDMSGMSFAHYRGITPSFIKKTVFAFQNYHAQPKKLECVSAPTYINIAITIFKSFMTEKMRNRVKVHFGGIEKAQQVVSKDILPVEYGGDGESIEVLGNLWHEKLVEYREWFVEDELYKAK